MKCKPNVFNKIFRFLSILKLFFSVNAFIYFKILYLSYNFLYPHYFHTFVTLFYLATSLDTRYYIFYFFTIFISFLLNTACTPK